MLDDPKENILYLPFTLYIYSSSTLTDIVHGERRPYANVTMPQTTDVVMPVTVPSRELSKTESVFECRRRAGLP